MVLMAVLRCSPVGGNGMKPKGPSALAMGSRAMVHSAMTSQRLHIEPKPPAYQGFKRGSNPPGITKPSLIRLVSEPTGPAGYQMSLGRKGHPDPGLRATRRFKRWQRHRHRRTSESTRLISGRHLNRGAGTLNIGMKTETSKRSTLEGTQVQPDTIKLHGPL